MHLGSLRGSTGTDAGSTTVPINTTIPSGTRLDRSGGATDSGNVNLPGNTGTTQTGSNPVAATGEAEYSPCGSNWALYVAGGLVFMTMVLPAIFGKSSRRRK